MANDGFFFRQYSKILGGLFVALLFGLNIFTAFNINIINDESLDQPGSLYVHGNISDTIPTTIASTPKITTMRSNEIISPNVTEVTDTSSSVRVAPKDQSNAIASAGKFLTSTAPISSVPSMLLTANSSENHINVDMAKLKTATSHTSGTVPKFKNKKKWVGVKRTSVVDLPSPILIASLPKSATSSTSRFFTCGGYDAFDHGINSTLLIGECYENNVLNGRPPFKGCGKKSVWSDTGYMHESGQCYFPSIDGLEAFYASYPNATIVLMTRSPDSWYNSIQRYVGGKVKLKMKLCNATGFPGINATSVDWKNMYLWHQERVRNFARLHPSITYLEFSVDDPKVAQKLQNSTGIRKRCWKVINSNKKDLDLKKAADLINNQKKGKRLPMDYRNLRPGLSSTLKQLRNLDQVADLSRMEMRLPTPIFVAGLPDSSTSNRIHDYFTCGGYKSANFWTNTTSNKQVRIGVCFQNNVNNGRPPFEGCGDAEVWIETGYATMDGQCYHPSVDGLEAFRKAYPNGTILMMNRFPQAWSLALSKQHRLLRKLDLCNTTKFPRHPANQTTVEKWISIYQGSQILIRSYGYQYPSLTYLEFTLFDPELSQKMEAVIGVNKSCWKRSANEKRYNLVSVKRTV